jgi:acyl-homoserine-lactone acylase
MSVARRAIPFAALALVLAACGERAESERPEAAHRFDTEIRWTSYGIPHVTARDWASLGYGFAYATARSALCTLGRDIVMVNGELSRHFGPADGNRESDIFHRAVLDETTIRNHAARQSEQGIIFTTGYVAGYNRYLRDHRDTLPAGCADAKWLRPITADDVTRLTVGVGIRYGLGRFQREMANAAPVITPVARLDTDFDVPQGFGSNAIAMGRAVTSSGRGLLFGNPHYPWRGSSRFHIIHLTIPGAVDVMGASLYNTSRIGIGFNRDVAWTHTVSTALRSTLYELTLNPENPLQYRYGDGWRDMRVHEVEIGVADATGSVARETHRVHFTHHGPVLVSAQLPWTRERAYAIRDANLHNDRSAATYDALSRARSVDEVETAISLQGVFWTNTIAADRHGTAFYADISGTPHLDAGLLERCRRTPDGVPNSVVVLDGADPDCEWHDDPRSAVPGAMPAELMPRLRRDDYVSNSNDSHWLSNPAAPLEGYPQTIGSEHTPRSLRTRAGLAFIAEALARDVRLGPQTLQDMLTSHRNYGAELLLDDVLAVCSGRPAPVVLESGPVDLGPSCRTLAAWDRRATNESRGAHLWREFWRRVQHVEGLYREPFDLRDPVSTPRGIATERPEIHAAVREALAGAQAHLAAHSIPIDAPLGSIQYTERNGERIPIPGGEGWAGMWSMIVSELRPEAGYTPIVHGNSYVQVVGWNPDGTLDARAMLAYSQSDDPGSPHYADLTRLYSRGEWIRLPFTDEEIAADPNLFTLRLTE